MNCDIFKDWFMKQFVPSVKKFQKEKKLPQKAILLLDNAPSHPSEEQLDKDDTKAVFLPPNITSLIQPMDQGVIEKVKRQYRKRLLQFLIEGIDDGKKLLDHIKGINMKVIAYASAASWEEVTAQSLIRSWRKLWPNVETLAQDSAYEDVVLSLNESVDNDAVISTTTFLNIFKRLPGCESAVQEELESWLDSDIGNSAQQILTDNEIVSAVNKEPHIEIEEENETESDVSAGDVTAALEVAMRYFERQDFSTATELSLLKQLRDIAAKQRGDRLHQKKITAFFKA